MTPTYACKNGGPRYAYYVCTNAIQHGRKACPSGSLPNTAIEQWVTEQARNFAIESATNKEPIDPFGDWDSLAIHEQADLLRSWVARVEYDGALGKASIAFHSPEHPITGSRHGGGT